MLSSDSFTYKGIVSWHGRPHAAIPIRFDSGGASVFHRAFHRHAWQTRLLSDHVHEAFHAFQYRQLSAGRGMKPGGDNAAFPDTAVEALTLLQP